MSPLQIESKHYMVLPAPRFWNSPSNNNFQINFSGIAIIKDFKGAQNGSWNNDILEILKTEIGWNNIMGRVQNILPPLPPTASEYAFIPLQWTTYGSVNSQFDENNSVNAGFGAWNFGIRRYLVYVNEAKTQQANNLSGMYINIQVRDKDAIIYRIGYSMNLYGYFTPQFPPIID